MQGVLRILGSAQVPLTTENKPRSRCGSGGEGGAFILGAENSSQISQLYLGILLPSLWL